MISVFVLRLAAHIFFDDAFEIESEESTRTVINGFVRDFLKIVKKATKNVYRTEDIWIKPPLKYSTPYGGRLEYTMPGENKLYVHLKDKDKIRHKKRWSQVGTEIVRCKATRRFSYSKLTVSTLRSCTCTISSGTNSWNCPSPTSKKWRKPKTHFCWRWMVTLTSNRTLYFCWSIS